MNRRDFDAHTALRDSAVANREAARVRDLQRNAAREAKRRAALRAAGYPQSFAPIFAMGAVMIATLFIYF